MNFETITRTVAPTVATALIGPLGGIAANVISNSLFGPERDPATTTPQAVMDAVNGSTDPELIAKLKRAELDLRAYESQNAITFAKIDESGVENARQARLQSEAQGDHFTDTLGWVVMLSFIGVATLILAGCGLFISGVIDVSRVNPNTLVAVSGVVGAILGYFSGNAQQVVNFYFGSSAGSKARADKLAGTAQRALELYATQGIGSGTDGGGAAAGRSAPTLVRPITAAPIAPASGRQPPPTGNAPVDIRPDTPVSAAAGVSAATLSLTGLTALHSAFNGSVLWQMTTDGVSVNGATPLSTQGPPSSVRRAWSWFATEIAAASAEFSVPIELIVAIICNESVSGASSREEAETAERQEPGYVSERDTPQLVSIGPMQTLLTTARAYIPGSQALCADDLRHAATSIRAGTAFMASSRTHTRFDPPLVAAAYNAGSVRHDPSNANRWKLTCYPAGTGEYVEKMVSFFNDAVQVCRIDGWSTAAPDAVSFVSMLDTACGGDEARLAAAAVTVQAA